ncbi:MAG: GGDEF domain-containing protein [Clostridiales bacterium]|nr:GGDEF domain-containing protein [Clostridiales bacterium]
MLIMLTYRLNDMGTRRRIAVFTSSIYEPMVRTMINGVLKAAEETGDKVICFTSFSDSYSSKVYGKFHLYDEGDVVAIELPDLNDFDGIIKVDQSMNGHAHGCLMKRLTATKLPVINVGSKEDGLINILNDESASFGNIVEHVITVHGCSDIYHLAGIKDKYFTIERVEAYKRTLAAHGIEFDPEKVYYGTLWRDCGEAALDYFLEQSRKRGKKYPEAIICANDYSAMGLVAACRNRGIAVPGDIIITGYDGIEEAYQGFPSITTSEQPFYQSGYDSVYALHRIWEGEKITGNIRIHGKLMCKQSCGCEPLTTNSIDDIRKLFQGRLDGASYLSQSMINLSLGVSGADTIEDCFREISENAAVDTGFEDMLLCLPHDWNKKRIIDEHFHEIDEEMTVVAGFINREPVEKQTFRKKDIIPKDLMDSDKPYFIFPIHHLQYYMGYMIVSPEDKTYNKLTMLAWIVNLGCMLDNWRVRQELSSAVRHMENLYNRDMLTNLYNRHGFVLFFDEFCDECIASKTPLALLLFDMDDLKHINDEYGHAEGDYSLCAIAESMNFAAKNGEICVRSGGDEFTMIAKGYTEEMAQQFVSNMREHLECINKRDRKPFNVSFSTGNCIMVPASYMGSITEISEKYLKAADEKMYEEKKQHKAGRDR